MIGFFFFFLLSLQTFRSALVQSSPHTTTGPNPFGFHVSTNSSVFQLGRPLYFRVRPLPTGSLSSASPCYFNVSMRFLHTTAVFCAPHDQPVSVETPARPAVSYHAVWIPSDDLGTVSRVNLRFSEVAYAWNSNGTVCFPLTVFYGYSETAELLNIADSAVVEYTESFFYQPLISIAIDRHSVGCFLLIAVRTEGVSSWVFEGGVTMTPFLLTPSNSIKGSLSSYRNVVQTYIFLYSTEYTAITLSASKTSSDFRSLSPFPRFSNRRSMFVAVDAYPSPSRFDWSSETPAKASPLQVNVTIDRSHAKYCNECKYFVTVMLNGSLELSTNASQLAIEFVCPGDVCSNCSEGRDPLQNCQECLDGFYGTNCSPCRDCHHGECADGLSGDGSCVCSTGFSAYSNCTECKTGFFGETCAACESCNEHGDCQDGRTGDGSCVCDEGFDAAQRCGECVEGRFGSACNETCPGETAVCRVRGWGSRIGSAHGECDDGMLGTGRCKCSDGFVGLSSVFLEGKFE